MNAWDDHTERGWREFDTFCGNPKHHAIHSLDTAEPVACAECGALDTLSVYEQMWDEDSGAVTYELLRLEEQAAFVRSVLIALLVVACIVLAGMVTGR